MFNLRRVSDFKLFEFFVGCLQMLWSTIPVFKINGSLFASILNDAGLNQQWGFVMLLSGAYLVVGAVFRRRETLHIAQFLSMMVWMVMTAMVANSYYFGNYENVITPVMLSLPLLSGCMLFAVFRSMLYCPVGISDRRKSCFNVDRERRAYG